MQAAMLGSVVASVASGPGGATDLQAMVLVVLARCSVGGGTSNAAASGGYKLVTPFALSDTARGALGGNALAFGALLVCVVGAAAALRLWKGMSTKDACVMARFPGLLLLASATLHQSTLFCAVRLCGGDGDGVVDSLMGGTAIVVCLVVPFVSLVAAAKLPRRFVQYEMDTGSRFSVAPLSLFVPVGVTLPRETRLMASSLITSYVYPSPLCVGVPFMSSLITNIVALLPSNVPGWLCAGSMFASALVHLLIAVAIAGSRMFRFPSSTVLGVLGLLLTAAFHAQIASGSRGGVDQTITAQAVLSMVRSAVACFITWLEGSMMEDEAARTTRVMWTIGDGGLEREMFCSAEYRDVDPVAIKDDAESEMVLLPPSMDADDSDGDKGSSIDEKGDEDEVVVGDASHRSSSNGGQDAALRPTEVKLDAFAVHPFALGSDANGVDMFARYVEEAEEHKRRLAAKGLSSSIETRSLTFELDSRL